MIRFTTLLTIVMLVIFTVMVLLATQYPPGARFMPLVVGIPGIGLCLLQIALDVRHARRTQAVAVGAAQGKAPKLEKAPRAADTVDAEEPDAGTVKRELVMWSYFVGFIAGLLLFGFWIAVPVMLITFLRNEARASWAMTLGLGVGATIILYLIFQVLLQIRLHAGFLTPDIVRWLGL